MPKEGEVVANEHGAKQCHVAARMDLIPPENLLLLGECLAYGAQTYGEGNWKGITIQDNLNHALVHILKWLSGDRTEPHLVNVLARTNFALWHAIQTGEQPKFYNHPNLMKDQDEDGEEEFSILHCVDDEEAERFSKDTRFPYFDGFSSPSGKTIWKDSKTADRATRTRYRDDGVKP